jgi:glycogen(starch) synthase
VRIAILSREYPPDTAWGGVATVYHSLAHALVQRGHEVHVICQAVDKPGNLVNDGVFVHRVGTNSKRYSALARINYTFHAWLELKRVIKEYGIEIVQAAYWGAEGFLYSLRRQTPLVVGLHSSAQDVIRSRTYSGLGELMRLRILSQLEDAAVKRADKVIANSEATYAQAMKKLHLDAKKIDLVPHAIDTSKYRFVASDIRERLGIPRETPLVLLVGRLEARKGIHILGEAIPRVIQSLPLTKFVLVGQDTRTAPDGDSVKRYLMKRGKDQDFADSLLLIDFLSQEELLQLYSACDLFVQPSLHESFGLTTLEAMACGKPVVTTSTGIVPQLGLDGASGIMVSPGDARALAEAIVKLLSLKDEDKERIARKNREIIEARFSIAVWTDRMLEVYHRALAGGRGQQQRI